MYEKTKKITKKLIKNQKNMKNKLKKSINQ